MKLELTLAPRKFLRLPNVANRNYNILIRSNGWRMQSGYQRGCYRGLERSSTVISMFRHPLGDPSNPDLDSRASSEGIGALGCIHVRIFPFNRVSH